MSVPVTSWPLVGRKEELALASELLQRDAGGIVLAGAIGVGKTRLAREILEEAEAKGYTTAWATATRAAASIPYGALAHLLPAPASEAGGSLAFFQRAVARLAERADGHRLALAIDDAYLLDDASATFVQHIATTGTARVVAVVRTGEPAPDSVIALWKEGLCDRLEVQALSLDEVAELLMRVLSDQVEARTLRQLWRNGGGNPLYLRELVLGGLETGALSKSSGIWRWRGSVAVPRLVELIELRLAALGPDERAALELVALGEPVETEILASLVEADVLQRAERRSLLHLEHDGNRSAVRLAHPLYGEILRARVPGFRARELYRQLAKALEQSGIRRRNDLLRIAVLQLEGGGRASPDVLVAAARQAETAFDLPLAERLARRAAEAGGGVPAGIVLGRALQEQGRSTEAEAVLGGLASQARTDTERAELAELRSGNLFWGLGRLTEAEETLKQGEQAIADRSRREELLSLRVGFACAAGRPLDALDAAAPILEGNDSSRRAVLRTLLHVVPGLAIVGRTERALIAARRWPEVASALDDKLPFAPGHLVIGRLLALRLAGRLSEAEYEGAEGYERALEQGDQDSMALIAMFLGQVMLEQGRVKAAARLLREARAILLERDLMRFLPWCRADLARALALSGDVAQASSALDEAKAAQSESMRIDRAALGTAAVWVAVANGELSRARRLTFSVAEEAQALGQASFAAIAFHDLTRLGEPQAVVSKLQAIAAGSEGRLFPLFADHASMLAERCGERLEVVARRFENLGAHLLAAESASEAAAAYRADGKLASARAAGALARMLASRCEAQRTPALTLVGCVEGLTAREREVAALAAAGLPNREIASRLVVSTRTVENHLQHAYRKLGVTTRRELRLLLEPALAE